jgi:hypothetical protein
MAPGSLDELPGLLIELRGLIQEGHGVVKDLERLLKEARKVRDDLPEAVNAKIGEAVDTGLTEYKAELAKAIDEATERVYRRFDVLTEICLGQDPKSVRDGQTTVPDLLRDFIATKGLPYRLVHVPPGLAKDDD